MPYRTQHGACGQKHRFRRASRVADRVARRQKTDAATAVRVCALAHFTPAVIHCAIAASPRVLFACAYAAADMDKRRNVSGAIDNVSPWLLDLASWRCARCFADHNGIYLLVASSAERRRIVSAGLSRRYLAA